MTGFWPGKLKHMKNKLRQGDMEYADGTTDGL
jgi:hypothetical protein